MKRKYSLIVAGIILLIALILRTGFLSIIPNGLHVDELDAGYIGRYIIEHGKDITGQNYPLYYNKFGDYRPTGIFYLSGLFVKIFGPTITAIRLPGALLGSLTVLSVMGLSYVLFGSFTEALLSGFILAILPWHIVLSRATSEGIAGLFFLTTGIVIFLYGCKRKLLRFCFYGAGCIGLSYLFYHTFRLLTPLILLPFLFYPSLTKKIKQSVIGIISFFFLFTIFLSVTGSGSGRFNQVAFYANPLLNNKTEEMLVTEGQNNILRARIFHNKVVIMTREFIVQYFKYFSLDYLFINGGLPDRYKIPEQGLMYIIFLPFILAGIAGLLKDKKTWQLLFIMWLLLISPLPAALTYEDTPNIHRSLIMIIPCILLAGHGAVTLYTRIRSKPLKNICAGCIGIILVVELSYFLHQYAIHAKSYKPFYRNDRYFEIAQFLKTNTLPNTVIYVPGYEHFPLYIFFADGNFQTQQFSKDSNDVLLPAYKKIRYVHTWCPTEDVNPSEAVPNALYLDRDDCLSNGSFRSVSTWVRKDATTAFRLLEKVNSQ